MTTELMSREDIADVAGVHVNTVDNWRRNDPTFPTATRLGPRLVRWPAEKIDAWFDGRDLGCARRRGLSAEELLP